MSVASMYATDPDGHRAHRPWRARIRHLQPAAQRADHLPGHADRRHGRKPRSSRSCCTSNPRTRTRTSRSTSTARAARSTRASRSTTRCSSSSRRSRRSASGIAMSMGSLLLMAGAKGKRFSLPNSRILIHQPSAGFEGQSTDIEIHAREILNIRAADRRDLRPPHRPAGRAGARRHGARPLLQG